ncbi:hypothetical protein H4R19_000936 [Coemansia spiralis]|nr:hypothetical protein H4R19_000936 [Coemansia spiralis]
MVPNAWVLRFVDARRLLAPAFGEQLSQHYHQQLRILHFDGRTDMPPTNSFPQVRDLYFAGTYLLPDHIPQVDAAKLERLRLHRVDPLHSWAAFGADNSSGMIKFSALTSFSVDYVPVNNIGRAPVARDRRSVKLGFPLLRSARIECPSGLCPMLAGAVFPCLMESLDIRISAPVWRSISHMELPVATRLKLAILSSVGDDTRLPLSFNQLLTNSHQCGDATLRADFHEPSAYLPRIALTGLTGLVVGVPISADMLLDIIGKLPRLVTLVALRSKRDPIQADIAIPGPSECHPVEPLDAKLQTLSYGQRDAHELSDADVVIYQYLLLKLPSLQWFGTRSKLTEKLAPFVEAYQEWYPHLAGVDFCRIDYQRF